MTTNTFAYKLPVIITKQNKRFMAYTPALDIATSGKTEKDVKQKFEELAALFLEEIRNAGTIADVLTELGWVKQQKRWNPPQVISSTSIGIDLPVFA
jgi:predicted RNase H-like HicB family nuclease